MIRVTIGGNETINLSEKVCTGIRFDVITPEDSNARSTDQYTQLFIEGKVIPSVSSSDVETTVALDRWAQVADDKADAYRPVEATVIESGVVLRKYSLPNAFIVDYDVDYADAEGVGEFKLLVRQKKDKTTAVSVDGGFAN